MASIINASINLNDIPKHKIIDGKKGKYLPITITINDEPDNFGNQGPITVGQSKEERESKAAKVYLGNVKVLQPAIRFSKDECLDLPDVMYQTREIPLTPQVQKY